MEDQVKLLWRKASYSGNGGGSCVEVARNQPGTVVVRDSKNPDGPRLSFAPEAWADLTASVKVGKYDL